MGEGEEGETNERRTISGFPVRVNEEMPEDSFGLLQMGTMDSYVRHEGLKRREGLVAHVVTRDPQFTMSRPDGEGGRRVVHVTCDGQAVSDAYSRGGVPAAMKAIRETAHVVEDSAGER